MCGKIQRAQWLKPSRPGLQWNERMVYDLAILWSLCNAAKCRVYWQTVYTLSSETEDTVFRLVYFWDCCVTITRVQLRVWPRNDISVSVLGVGSMFCRKLWYNTFFHVFIFGFCCYPSMHRFIVVIKSASLYIDFENDLNSTKREQCFFLKNSFLPIIQLDQMNTDLKMSVV